MSNAEIAEALVISRRTAFASARESVLRFLARGALLLE